jgi:hypothetical protein
MCCGEQLSPDFSPQDAEFAEIRHEKAELLTGRIIEEMKIICNLQSSWQ